jgi:hypothetical protein
MTSCLCHLRVGDCLIFARSLILLEALGLTMFIFGLLIWGYVILIQVTHPEWLSDALTHHAFAPLNWRVDDIGIAGFIAALFGFLVWMLGLGCNKKKFITREEQT